MDNLNEISFYQFENLILQKVPFKLVSLSLDSQQVISTCNHLNSYYLNFLKEQLINLRFLDSMLNEFLKLPLTQETPVVLLCEDGLNSKNLALNLEQKGYKNVFVISGGLNQLLKDKMT